MICNKLFLSFLVVLSFIVAAPFKFAYSQQQPPQVTTAPKKTLNKREKADRDSFFAEIMNDNFYKTPEGDDQSQISKPHRTVEELSEWLSGIVMNTLEIRAATPKEDAQKSKSFFTKKAYRDFLTFLQQQSYWIFITQRKYNMNASSTRPPAVLCALAVNGYYTWLFEVPVIINLNETPDTPNAQGKNAKEVINLRIRLVRIPNMALTNENPHQVLIESWSVQDDSAILNNNVEGCMN